MPDDIGAKIVVTGDTSGARTEVKGLTDETKALTATTDRARTAGGQFAASQQAAQGATQATGSGIGALKGNLVELAGALPGVGGALSGAIGGASGAFGQLSGVASAAASGPLAAVAAGVGVVTAGLGLAEKALDSFANKQDKVTGLDAALASQGELTDEYRVKLQKLAGEYGHATGMGSAWYGVLTRLTQMGADSSNIDRYAEGVKNLAAILGGDIDRAATVFGRAMNGNYQLLHRYGIEVDKSKDQHAQLDEIMAQLATRGAGQLEARTHTLHGLITQFNGAVGMLFSGFGNLINQTGVVQATLGAFTTVLRGIGSLLPKTVEQVDGLTNRLPPLRDEFGRVKGAADETGDELDDVGGSSDSAAAGLGRAGEAAGKTKDAFEQATEAAKKLRQGQDQMAEAQTALKLAQVDADEAKKLAVPGANKDAIGQDANRQRAQIRNDTEQAAIGRKVDEQDAIIEAQINKRFEAQQHAADKSNARQSAEGAFAGAAGAAGLTPEQAEKLAADSEQQNKDLFGEKAKGLRSDASSASDAARSLDQGEEADPVAAEQSRQQAAAATQQAEALEKLAKAMNTVRQARADEGAATQHFAQVQDEANKAIADAKTEEKRLGIEQRTATVKAGTEAQKLDAEAQKRAAQQAEELRQTELKRLDQELKKPGITDPRRQQVVDARRSIERDSDKYADRDATPAQRAQNEALRRTERTERDAKDTGGGDAVVGDARKVLDTLPTAAPSSLSGQARSMIQEIIKGGGKDAGKDGQLMEILRGIVENQQQQGRSDPQKEALLKQLKRDVDDLNRRLKST